MRITPDLPIEEMRGRLSEPQQLLDYLSGGRAVITIRSQKTSERYTFKFTRTPESNRGRSGLWVALLNAPSDSPENRYYEFLGTIWTEPEGLNYRHSLKSRFSPNSPHERAINWMVRKINHQQFDSLFKQAEFWHEGRCGRCGRRLTVPESIETGFGPECEKRRTS